MERRKADIFSPFVFNNLQNSCLIFHPRFFCMTLAVDNFLTHLFSIRWVFEGFPLFVANPLLFLVHHGEQRPIFSFRFSYFNLTLII